MGATLAIAPGCREAQAPQRETRSLVALVAMPGPARAREAWAVRENAACEGCHEEQAREWRASLHRRADVEPTYRRAFDLEPLPFCRGCHAPEATPDEPEQPAVAALGVGCVTCHASGGTVLAAPWRGPLVEPAAPHSVTRDPRFAGPEACAGCHEFAFPGRSGREVSELMQTTVTEHRGSAEASVPCAGCHMPRPEGAARARKSHLFPASREPSVVKSAVRVTAERSGATGVRVVLTPLRGGHAFPTGDLFRRVEVWADIEGPDHASLGARARYLARHFATKQGMPGKQLVGDDRVFREPVEVVLELGPAAAGRAISYRVAYQRVEHPSGVDERDATVDGEIVLAEGTLAEPGGEAR